MKFPSTYLLCVCVVLVILALGQVNASAGEDPAFHGAALSKGIVSFRFQAAAPGQYEVQVADGSPSGEWSRHSKVTAEAGGEFLIQDSAFSDSRFYRLSSESGPVYSANAVGYINVSWKAGTNLIAAHFYNPPNRLTNHLPYAPENTRVWKPGRHGIECAEFYNGMWRDCVSGLESEMTLYPGQGLILKTEVAYTNTFVGAILEGAMTNYVPAGQSLCSSIVPQQGGLQTMLGFAPRRGDVVYEFDAAIQTYRRYIFEDPGWRPREPRPAVATAFWLELSEPAVWARNFELNGGNNYGGYYWVTSNQHLGPPWIGPGRQPPTISNPVATRVVGYGIDLNFNPDVWGSPLMHCQWRYENQDISGATNGGLSLKNVQPSDSGVYAIVVSNSFGCITSIVEHVTVDRRPGLQLRENGGAWSVCWAVSATNYVLEGAASWTGDWIEVPGARSIANARQCVSLPTYTGTRFYRLRAPDPPN